MKNLITGATGFVGSHIVEKFRNEGEDVIGLARKSSDTSYLEKLGAEIHYGDLTDYDSVKKAVAKSDRVIHAGAITGEWIGKKESIEVNVRGTKNLLDASLENKIDRFVFVSSLGVMGLRNHYHTGVDVNYEKANDNYIDSKIETEKLVREYSEHRGLPTTILRPGFVYGPQDRRLMKRMLENFGKGRVMFIGDGKNKMNLVYAGNFADAVYLSTQTDKAIGQIYNVTDNNGLDIETFFYKIADLWGFKRPTKHISVPVAKVIANVLERTARLTGKKEPPVLTKTRLKFLSLNLDFDISKTIQDLGYEPRVSIDEGLRKTKEWIDKENPYKK
ncbi:MAG: NAD-dependent epimerase/dehydratase family protein [Nanoarchaeota archaeon]|nr:NAD-dependent epimerase/dehydratase family protein [Nanoarchaeota archaeon]